MAGLFSNEGDVMSNIMQRRQQANQALGSPYGKYGGIVQAGGMFADIGADAAAGGGYGAADPRMQQQKELKQIAAVVAQQFPGKTDSPDFYKALALAVQDKYPQKAQEAMQMAAKREQEILDKKLTGLKIKDTEGALAEREAAQERAKQEVTRNQKAVTVLFPDTAPELRDAIANDPELFRSAVTAQFKTKDVPTQVVTIGDRVKLINSSTGAEIADIGPAPNQPKTRVEVNLGDKGAAAYGAAVGKGIGEKDLSLVNTAETAGESLPKIAETLTVLNQGDPTTGIGAELINNIDRLKAQFLNDKKAGKRVTDTEYLDALLGSEVFPMISALGIGARGLDTPAEREFLRGVFTGTIPMNKQTLIKLTETRKNIAERAVKKYNNMLEEGSLSKFEEAQGRKLKPIKVDIGGAGGKTQTSAGTVYEILED